jgi:2-amino-4-hydroxy-6-hydroxymethyldihydropteridine diphosphokinase
LPKLALISIGSNIDPENHLPLAAQKLKEIGSIVGFSTVYQNPAIGSTPQPDFLNAVAMIETDLTADAIRNTLRRIEVDLGRLRNEDKYAPRTIDLD